MGQEAGTSEGVGEGQGRSPAAVSSTLPRLLSKLQAPNPKVLELQGPACGSLWQAKTPHLPKEPAALPEVSTQGQSKRAMKSEVSP